MSRRVVQFGNNDNPDDSDGSDNSANGNSHQPKAPGEEAKPAKSVLKKKTGVMGALRSPGPIRAIREDIFDLRSSDDEGRRIVRPAVPPPGKSHYRNITVKEGQVEEEAQQGSSHDVRRDNAAAASAAANDEAPPSAPSSDDTEKEEERLARERKVHKMLSKKKRDESRGAKKDEGTVKETKKRDPTTGNEQVTRYTKAIVVSCAVPKLIEPSAAPPREASPEVVELSDGEMELPTVKKVFTIDDDDDVPGTSRRPEDELITIDDNSSVGSDVESITDALDDAEIAPVASTSRPSSSQKLPSTSTMKTSTSKASASTVSTSRPSTSQMSASKASPSTVITPPPRPSVIQKLPSTPTSRPSTSRPPAAQVPTTKTITTTTTEAVGAPSSSALKAPGKDDDEDKDKNKKEVPKKKEEKEEDKPSSSAMKQPRPTSPLPSTSARRQPPTKPEFKKFETAAKTVVVKKTPGSSAERGARALHQPLTMTPEQWQIAIARGLNATYGPDDKNKPIVPSLVPSTSAVTTRQSRSPVKQERKKPEATAKSVKKPRESSSSPVPSTSAITTRQSRSPVKQEFKKPAAAETTVVAKEAAESSAERQGETTPARRPPGPREFTPEQIRQTLLAGVRHLFSKDGTQPGIASPVPSTSAATTRQSRSPVKQECKKPESKKDEESSTETQPRIASPVPSTSAIATRQSRSPVKQECKKPESKKDEESSTETQPKIASPVPSTSSIATRQSRSPIKQDAPSSSRRSAASDSRSPPKAAEKPEKIVKKTERLVKKVEEPVTGGTDESAESDTGDEESEREKKEKKTNKTQRRTAEEMLNDDEGVAKILGGPLTSRRGDTRRGDTPSTSRSADTSEERPVVTKTERRVKKAEEPVTGETGESDTGDEESEREKKEMKPIKKRNAEAQLKGDEGVAKMLEKPLPPRRGETKRGDAPSTSRSAHTSEERPSVQKTERRVAKTVEPSGTMETTDDSDVGEEEKERKREQKTPKRRSQVDALRADDGVRKMEETIRPSRAAKEEALKKTLAPTTSRRTETPSDRSLSPAKGIEKSKDDVKDKKESRIDVASGSSSKRGSIDGLKTPQSASKRVSSSRSPSKPRADESAEESAKKKPSRELEMLQDEMKQFKNMTDTRRSRGRSEHRKEEESAASLAEESGDDTPKPKKKIPFELKDLAGDEMKPLKEPSKRRLLVRQPLDDGTERSDQSLAEESADEKTTSQKKTPGKQSKAPEANLSRVGVDDEAAALRARLGLPIPGQDGPVPSRRALNSPAVDSSSAATTDDETVDGGEDRVVRKKRQPRRKETDGLLDDEGPQRFLLDLIKSDTRRAKRAGTRTPGVSSAEDSADESALAPPSGPGTSATSLQKTVSPLNAPHPRILGSLSIDEGAEKLKARPSSRPLPKRHGRDEEETARDTSKEMSEEGKKKKDEEEKSAKLNQSLADDFNEVVAKTGPLHDDEIAKTHNKEAEKWRKIRADDEEEKEKPKKKFRSDAERLNDEGAVRMRDEVASSSSSRRSRHLEAPETSVARDTSKDRKKEKKERMLADVASSSTSTRRSRGKSLREDEGDSSRDVSKERKEEEMEEKAKKKHRTALERLLAEGPSSSSSTSDSDQSEDTPEFPAIDKRKSRKLDAYALFMRKEEKKKERIERHRLEKEERMKKKAEEDEEAKKRAQLKLRNRDAYLKKQTRLHEERLEEERRNAAVLEEEDARRDDEEREKKRLEEEEKRMKEEEAKKTEKTSTKGSKAEETDEERRRQSIKIRDEEEREKEKRKRQAQEEEEKKRKDAEEVRARRGRDARQLEAQVHGTHLHKVTQSGQNLAHLDTSAPGTSAASDPLREAEEEAIEEPTRDVFKPLGDEDHHEDQGSFDMNEQIDDFHEGQYDPDEEADRDVRIPDAALEDEAVSSKAPARRARKGVPTKIVTTQEDEEEAEETKTTKRTPPERARKRSRKPSEGDDDYAPEEEVTPARRAPRKKRWDQDEDYDPDEERRRRSGKSRSRGPSQARSRATSAARGVTPAPPDAGDDGPGGEDEVSPQDGARKKGQRMTEGEKLIADEGVQKLIKKEGTRPQSRIRLYMDEEELEKMDKEDMRTGRVKDGDLEKSCHSRTPAVDPSSRPSTRTTRNHEDDVFEEERRKSKSRAMIAGQQKRFKEKTLLNFTCKPAFIDPECGREAIRREKIEIRRISVDPSVLEQAEAALKEAETRSASKKTREPPKKKQKIIEDDQPSTSGISQRKRKAPAKTKEWTNMTIDDNGHVSSDSEDALSDGDEEIFDGEERAQKKKADKKKRAKLAAGRFVKEAPALAVGLDSFDHEMDNEEEQEEEEAEPIENTIDDPDHLAAIAASRASWRIIDVNKEVAEELPAPSVEPTPLDEAIVKYLTLVEEVDESPIPMPPEFAIGGHPIFVKWFENVENNLGERVTGFSVRQKNIVKNALIKCERNIKTMGFLEYSDVRMRKKMHEKYLISAYLNSLRKVDDEIRTKKMKENMRDPKTAQIYQAIERADFALGIKQFQPYGVIYYMRGNEREEHVMKKMAAEKEFARHPFFYKIATATGQEFFISKSILTSDFLPATWIKAMQTWPEWKDTILGPYKIDKTHIDAFVRRTNREVFIKRIDKTLTHSSVLGPTSLDYPWSQARSLINSTVDFMLADNKTPSQLRREEELNLRRRGMNVEKHRTIQAEKELQRNGVEPAPPPPKKMKLSRTPTGRSRGRPRGSKNKIF